jgi:hypothetical protein
MFISGCSFLLTSFLLFCLLEMFPSLIEPLRLHVIPYYAYRATFIADETLVFREKPFKRVRYDSFRGDHYSPIYGIDVEPVKVEWTLDENGFRNCCRTGRSDIVVLGDSYIEYGHTDSDTFIRRLEKKLPGLRVTNLGVSGYGPPQYLEVMKRYGLKYEPKYALMAFFEGNDIANTGKYLRWRGKRKENVHFDLLYVISEKSFFSRYWLMLTGTGSFIKKTMSREAEIVLGKMGISGYTFDIHPDVAVLKLGEAKYEKVLLVERLTSDSPDDLLKKEEWQEMRRILAEFKDVCEAHQIVPLLMYIPAGVHIYAPYSTNRSGRNWLQVREQQIAGRKNTEEAMTRLVQGLNLDMISLSAIFELAAKQGKLLHYNLDPHWNSEGRELASSFVADFLNANYLSPFTKRDYKQSTLHSSH